MKKYVYKKVTGLFLCLLLFNLNSSAQQEAPPTSNVTPDSKMLSGSINGAALGSMTTPDLFNGTLNINIPLYQFVFNQINFGVGISYNTQGVKVDEIESVAGLHWSLNTGASIVRVVRDLPDELRIDGDSILAKPYQVQNGQQIPDTLFRPNPEMHLYGKWYGTGIAPTNSSNTYEDREFDKFAVNLNGSSFEFYIDSAMQVFTIPELRYKVQVLLDGQAVTSSMVPFKQAKNRILNFSITDNQGVQYYFQAFEIQKLDPGYFLEWQSMDYWNNGAHFPDLSYISSWRVTKIVLPDGQLIKYHYDASCSQSGINYIPYVNHFVKEYAGQTKFVFGSMAPGNSVKREVTNDYLLSSIDYPNGESVSFEYVPGFKNAFGERFLKDIKVLGGDNCRSFDFSINPYNGRYYLDTITQSDCNGFVEPFYQFEYNKNKLITKPIYNVNPDTLASTYPPSITPFPGSTIIGYDTFRVKLPKRLNVAQDLFGYYNGDSTSGGVYQSNYSLKYFIPKHIGIDSSHVAYGNNRSYQPDFAQAGLLCSVKNAYGLREDFYYGSHYFKDIPLLPLVPDDSLFIGATQPSGVRIDSIVEIDRYQKEHRKTTIFDYDGGQIFMPGGYFHLPIDIDTVTGQPTGIMFQGQFLTAHQLIHNANQGYSKIWVKKVLDGKVLGQIEYSFTNLSDETSNFQPRYLKVPGSKDYFEYPYTDKDYLKEWEIGLPLNTKEFDGNGHLLRIVENKYNFSPIDFSAANNLKSQKRTLVVDMPLPNYNYNLPDTDPRVFIDKYYPYRGLALLARTVTLKYYSDTKYVPDTVWYEYDVRNNLKNTITQTSTGGRNRTTTIYNYDLDGPFNANYTHPGSTLYKMTSDGLEVPVSVERWKIGIGNQNLDKLLSAFITRYQYQNGKLWNEGLFTAKVLNPLPYNDYYGINTGGTYQPPFHPILDLYENNIIASNLEQTSVVTKFDEVGDVLETRLLQNGPFKAIVWDTTMRRKVAECSGCRTSDIAYTSFEGNLTGNNLLINNSNITDVGSMVTGNHCLYFSNFGVNGSPETPGQILGTQDLSAGKTYTLSFWFRYSPGGIPINISVGGQNVSLTGNNIVYQKGDWKNCQVRFTPQQAGKLMITNNNVSGLYLDEIRVYPSNSRMLSWTYLPLFGVSSQTDAGGRITYFQYDQMGRQNAVLDQDGNILSLTQYHVAK